MTVAQMIHRNTKELSIIIASQNAAATIQECLSSLQRQNQDGAAEIIVVDNSRDRSAEIVEEKFPDVQLVKVLDAVLIPELWARGVVQAVGKVVAFTTAHCIPDAAWIAETLRHHGSAYAGIGGAIENLQPASLTQWAIYFCRYTPYMPPFASRAVEQIPGDNASYKRWVFEEYAGLIKDGFWETVVNDRLRKDGHLLLLTPQIRVYHGRSFGVRAFCRQRFLHGRVFGAERTTAAPPAKRFVYLAFSPLVPVVFLAKMIRQILDRGRYYREFVLSLPLTALFVLCWALGEFLGYLQGASRAAKQGRGLMTGFVERH